MKNSSRSKYEFVTTTLDQGPRKRPHLETSLAIDTPPPAVRPAAVVLGTNHTSFTVSDVHRSVRLFNEVLGFPTTSIGPRDPTVIEAITGVLGASTLIAYVRGPGHSIELIEYLGPADRSRVRPRPCDVGFAHLAYDVEGLDELCAAFHKHDVLQIAPPVTVTNGPNAGKKAVYLRDWDGLTIELIGR